VTSYPIHTLETAPAPARDQLRQVQETLGQIPNLAAGMAEAPTLLRSFFAVREIYAQGTLTPLEVQVLSLANAIENGCEWCVAFHSAMALKTGLSEKALAALRSGQPAGEQRLDALSRLTRRMIADRGRVGAEELREFQAAGFSRAQALEVVLGIGFSVMANFAGHLIQPPLDAALERFAWTTD
jgi:AhpD family alkylhydroperoxidase